jgi:hypothetical protein
VESDSSKEVKSIGKLSVKSKPIKKAKKSPSSSSSSEEASDSSSSDDSEEVKKPIKRRASDDEDVSSESSDDDGHGPRGPLPDLYTQRKRGFTVSIVVPSSIIDNAQSFELKTYLVGQIARACGIFKVNEVIVLSNDRTQRMKNMSGEITTTEFFVRNLEYIETPQYLRKSLFPRSDALKYSGLVNPLEGDHHLKITEWCRYREGVIMRRPVREGRGSWANIGLYKDC